MPVVPRLREIHQVAHEPLGAMSCGDDIADSLGCALVHVRGSLNDRRGR
jgi:hypothetical protein